MFGSRLATGWLLGLALALPMIALLAQEPQGAASRSDRPAAVIGSKHDLSATGPVTAKSVRADACVFCHGSHSTLSTTDSAVTAPLWNRDLPVNTYNTYDSSTYNAGAASAAMGRSKLCLSCHDGTIAPGQTLSGEFTPLEGDSKGGLLGTDLSRDHPFAIRPVDDGQLALSLFTDPPETQDPTVQLRSGVIDCLTCHSSHVPDLDPTVPKFLVRSNRSGALCLACHDPSRPQPNRLSGWELSAHATSNNTVPTTEPFGAYGSVDANACSNCHRSHNAAAARLQTGAEEEACQSCHGGSNISPALADVMSELSKRYAHPVTSQAGLHDPAEDAFPLSANRHSECADCHNPHAAGLAEGTNVPPRVQNALAGVGGFDGTSELRPAANEYQVCFKCHADSPNKPQTSTGPGPYGWTALRQTDTLAADPFNTRLEFASSVSRHNVSSPRGGAGSNSSVPSLRPAIRLPNGSTGRSLASGTHLYCTDCHNNNSARSFGGLAPNGPHGSDYEHLLASPYPMNSAPAFAGEVMGEVNFSSGASTYLLCNSCHYLDRDEHADALLNDRTFAHRLHVQDAGTSCATCHDSHGIQGGDLTSNPSLINFDMKVVAPLPGMPSPQLESMGSYTGRCYLQCHSKRHDSQFY